MKLYKLLLLHVNLLRNSKYQFLCSVSENVLSWKKLTRKFLEEHLWQKSIRVTTPFLTHFFSYLWKFFPIISKEKAGTNCFHITFQCFKNVMPGTYLEPLQTSKMKLFIIIFVIIFQLCVLMAMQMLKQYVVKEQPVVQVLCEILFVSAIIPNISSLLWIASHVY